MERIWKHITCGNSQTRINIVNAKNEFEVLEKRCLNSGHSSSPISAGDKFLLGMPKTMNSSEPYIRIVVKSREIVEGKGITHT